MSEKKKFGLVVPKKAAVLKISVSSVFNDESDDEQELKKRPKIPQKKMPQRSSVKTESDIDPTIYEYDSIYDEMKTKQAESRGPKEIKKSRYIETLLKSADKRKKEHERRVDRKIQIEREKEGDQFKDKEAFVTSSYKKKLQEKEEEEERERRENAINDMMDVTKQKDLSGFYRHFLNQTVGEEKVPKFGERHIKKEVESDEDHSVNKSDEKEKVPTFGEKQIKKEVENDEDLSINKGDENLDQDSDGIEIDNEDDDSERDFSNNENSNNEEKKKTTFKRRKTQHRDRKKVYRKQCSSSMSESFRRSKSPEDDVSNSDASSNEYKSNEATKSSYLDKNKECSRSNKNKLNDEHDSSSSDDEQSNKSASSEMQTTVSKEEKQKNIYAKRTVGDVFAEAQARYFQRMAMRNS